MNFREYLQKTAYNFKEEKEIGNFSKMSPLEILINSMLINVLTIIGINAPPESFVEYVPPEEIRLVLRRYEGDNYQKLKIAI